MALQNDRLFALHDEGKSMTEIAEIVGMDRRQVKTILESLTKTHDYHPYGLTDESKWPEIKARIIEMHRENKEVLTYKIIKEIKEKFNEKVGLYCVARVREEADVNRKQKKYGQFVREPNREKRVNWALAKKDEDDMFTNVFFADEASVEIENVSPYVWVFADDPYGHISQRVKHPQRVMIWLAISMMGATQIKILGPKENINAEVYVKIVEEYYIPSAKKLYGNRCRLAHDNARVHTAKYTTEKLAEMGVQVMPWPAESPDMMPVEHAFAHLKAKLRTHYKPKNKAELIEAILKFREEFLTKEYCRNTIRHIHTAMKQVIRREGNPVRGKRD
ncbi:hypothetical protein PRIPAC_77065 [Pristionchus pacificus]|uniref:DDE_3 domain-containing protein n=1 Tax=Pristionchus pacificus TaxID=54126 RepID=A0A2A6CMA3_PRIPA|nr:hypothetical protein PRIPAC_77065 [Pristionchus pacificus]|eukprot:PDM79220.1 hypothetical protein PRIPAC_31799 [Pristionchus pacificus]